MDWLETWDGYLPPTSNTTYTPNQFFDVVLPSASRGVLRLIAYLIRKTLGWSDAHGRPQNPLVKVSYRELERNAGIARSMLRAALDEALAARYIECVEEGRPDTLAAPGTSALYKLRWDARKEYVTSPEEFDGFFAGNGNLTYIPNQFFDATIPNEPLAVIKVVGVIIRQTIGWQTEYGFRRQQVALSFTELEERTGLSRQSINLALHTALDHRHILRVEVGQFHADTGQQRAAVYGLKWADVRQTADPIASAPSSREPARKVDQEKDDQLEKLTREPARKVDQEINPYQLEKLTRTSSKSLPENQLEKLTSIKITDKEIKKEKQQQQETLPDFAAEPVFAAAAFSQASPSEYALLRERGVGHKAALEFAARPASFLDATWELVQQKHKPGMSLTGLYCTALRDNWLGELQAAANARSREVKSKSPAEKPVRTARQALREKNLPRLQTLFCRIRDEDTPTFAKFTAFCSRERARFADKFTVETARAAALKGFDGEENQLKLLLVFLMENPCPFSDAQEWIDSETPAALMKMFV